MLTLWLTDAMSHLGGSLTKNTSCKLLKLLSSFMESSRASSKDFGLHFRFVSFRCKPIDRQLPQSIKNSDAYLFQFLYLSVIASIPQNIDCVQYSRRTSLRVFLLYCTKSIFFGIDGITVLSYG